MSKRPRDDTSPTGQPTTSTSLSLGLAETGEMATAGGSVIIDIDPPGLPGRSQVEGGPGRSVSTMGACGVFLIFLFFILVFIFTYDILARDHQSLSLASLYSSPSPQW